MRTHAGRRPVPRALRSPPEGRHRHPLLAARRARRRLGHPGRGGGAGPLGRAGQPGAGQEGRRRADQERRVARVVPAAQPLRARGVPGPARRRAHRAGGREDREGGPPAGRGRPGRDPPRGREHGGAPARHPGRGGLGAGHEPRRPGHQGARQPLHLHRLRERERRTADDRRVARCWRCPTPGCGTSGSPTTGALPPVLPPGVAGAARSAPSASARRRSVTPSRPTCARWTLRARRARWSPPTPPAPDDLAHLDRLRRARAREAARGTSSTPASPKIAAHSSQTTCLATSPDLDIWTRHPANPVLRADPRWYDTLATGAADEPWRDPWVFPDPDGDGWHLIATARARSGAGGRPRRPRTRWLARPRSDGSRSRR